MAEKNPKEKFLEKLVEEHRKAAEEVEKPKAVAEKPKPKPKK